MLGEGRTYALGWALGGVMLITFEVVPRDLELSFSVGMVGAWLAGVREDSYMVASCSLFCRSRRKLGSFEPDARSTTIPAAVRGTAASLEGMAETESARCRPVVDRVKVRRLCAWHKIFHHFDWRAKPEIIDWYDGRWSSLVNMGDTPQVDMTSKRTAWSFCCTFSVPRSLPFPINVPFIYALVVSSHVRQVVVNVGISCKIAACFELSRLSTTFPASRVICEKFHLRETLGSIATAVEG